MVVDVVVVEVDVVVAVRRVTSGSINFAMLAIGWKVVGGGAVDFFVTNTGLYVVALLPFEWFVGTTICGGRASLMSSLTTRVTGGRVYRSYKRTIKYMIVYVFQGFTCS